MWHEAFDEAGGNTGTVVQHLTEVMQLLARLVEGPSWGLRRAAVRHTHSHTHPHAPALLLRWFPEQRRCTYEIAIIYI